MLLDTGDCGIDSPAQLCGGALPSPAPTTFVPCPRPPPFEPFEPTLSRARAPRAPTR